MAENWNIGSVAPLDDTNYFIWSEKVEGILRAKKLWKKVISVKPPEKPEENAENYETKLKKWNEWDDDNYAARALIINTMSEAQLLKYSHEKGADKLWHLIKNNMAAETEQLKSRSLSELTSLKMSKNESIDTYMNRAEALRNQCVQLGKSIENYELRMYIIKGLRPEFDQNVRVLEAQKELTVNDIRYTLKQEEVRRSMRKEEKTSRDEHARKARDKSRGDITCFNCGMKGHTSNECRNKQKCFNCQGHNHIAADCKEPKRYKSRGKGQRGTFTTRGRRKSESTLKLVDEAVLTVRDSVHVKKELINNKKEEVSDSSNNYIWLLDSGATSHMACSEVIFDNIEEDVRDISLADKEGKKLTSEGKGEIIIKQSSSRDNIRLTNVLRVPDININLLSVAKITDHGYNVKFDRYGAIVYREEDEIIMKATREENAYYVKSMTRNKEVATPLAATTQEIDVWHRRLGHINKKVISEMKKNDLVSGIKETDKEIRQCESCIEGKMCRKGHPRLTERKTGCIMDLWHMDLIGPIKPESCGGKRYIFTIVDDYSRVIFIELLREKGEAADKLKKLIVLKENQSGKKLKAIRSDNGGEFIGTYLEEWLKEKGIKHEFSPARTPQCNGVVERANRSVIEMTRTMLADSKMPIAFWAEATCTAAHIRNRSKSTVHGRTPYEVWNEKKPNIKYMRRFGCMAYILDKEERRKKFDSKVTKGIFVGYATNNTYRVYIPETGIIKTDCDVKFDESRNGCGLLGSRKNEHEESNERLIILGLDPEDNNEKMDEEDENEENGEITSDESREYEETDMPEHNETEEIENEVENVEEIGEQPIEIRAKGRPRGTTTAVMQVRRQEEKEERKQAEENVRRSERIKNQQAARLAMIDEIPKNVREAEQSNEWKYWQQAMKDELDSMKKHKVWDIISRLKGKKVIKCKWIFDNKQDPSTGRQRYKARLVASECGQRPGVDYEETFAPVVRTETIRLLFSISAQKGVKMKIYDVRTAFLHGILKEEIYMEIPDGVKVEGDKICKLRKSIYGLKQAGRCWNEHLTKVLERCGLKQSKEDPCLFYAKEDNKFLYCGIHVDDMPTVCSDDEFERRFMDKIKQYIDMKDLGEAKSVLGMQVEQQDGKIFVHQRKYIEKLLSLYGMEDCNSVRTPIDINTKMDECEDSERVETHAYQELIGRLMHLSVYTRPDLSFTLSCLSQFNHEPRMMHLSALKRVLRYLKGTIDFRLEFGRENSTGRIICDTDASWDRTKDAKSFTGLIVCRDKDLIHWKSKKQSTVALSSTESELEAILEGVKEVIWTSRLLQEIGVSTRVFKELRCDNLNAVRLSNGGNFKTKSKLMNRKCCFIKEAVKEEDISVVHVSSKDMKADCFTKPLNGPALMKQINRFMNIQNR